MELLNRLGEPLMQRCFECLDDLWKGGAKPGDDDGGDVDTEQLEVCPQCQAEQCTVNTTVQAISDDACTGRFDLRCTLCGFTGVVYGFVCDRSDHPRAAVSLEPFALP
jgi:hypothetical protein